MNDPVRWTEHGHWVFPGGPLGLQATPIVAPSSVHGMDLGAPPYGAIGMTHSHHPPGTFGDTLFRAGTSITDTAYADTFNIWVAAADSVSSYVVFPVQTCRR